MFNLFLRSRSDVWYLWYTDADGLRKQVSCRTKNRTDAKVFARDSLVRSAQTTQPLSVAPPPTDKRVLASRPPSSATKSPSSVETPQRQPSMVISESSELYVGVQRHVHREGHQHDSRLAPLPHPLPWRQGTRGDHRRGVRAIRVHHASVSVHRSHTLRSPAEYIQEGMSMGAY